MLLRLIHLFERRGGGRSSLRRSIASRLSLIIIISRIFCKTSRCLIVLMGNGRADDRLRALLFEFPLQLGMRKISLGVSRKTGIHF